MKSRPLMKLNKLYNTNVLLLWPVVLGNSAQAKLAGTKRNEPEPFVHYNGITGWSSTTHPKGQCIFLAKKEEKKKKLKHTAKCPSSHSDTASILQVVTLLHDISSPLHDLMESKAIVSGKKPVLRY